MIHALLLAVLFFIVIEYVAKWAMALYWIIDWDALQRAVAKLVVRVYDIITD